MQHKNPVDGMISGYDYDNDYICMYVYMGSTNRHLAKRMSCSSFFPKKTHIQGCISRFGQKNVPMLILFVISLFYNGLIQDAKTV